MNTSAVARRSPATAQSFIVPGAMPASASPRRLVLLLEHQLARYSLVGISNTVIGYVIYAAAVKLFDVQYEIALTIGYVVGAGNGYVLHRHWTFRGHQHGSHARSMSRYAPVTLAAYAINLILLHLAVSSLGVEKILAQAIIVPIVFMATFIPNRLWSFAHRHDEHPKLDAASDAQSG